MVNSASFPRFVKVAGGGGGGRGEALKLYVINLREQHPMLLHLPPRRLFLTLSGHGSVDETCKKKRMCIVLDWIAHYYQRVGRLSM